MIPMLGDIQLTSHTFTPGDRILAKTSCDITYAQNQRIERAIKKMTGEHVRVLVVNVNKVQLLRARDRETDFLVGEERIRRPKAGRFLLNCEAVDFQTGDKLVALLPYKVDGSQKAKITDRLKEWTGSSVEIIITKAVDFERNGIQQDTQRQIAANIREQNAGI